MRRCQSLNRFDLNNHGVVDQEVQSISGFQPDILKHDRQGKLLDDGAPAKLKLPAQTHLVDRLQQTGSQGSMNLQGRINDLAANSLKLRWKIVHPLSLCAFESSCKKLQTPIPGSLP